MFGSVRFKGCFKQILYLQWTTDKLMSLRKLKVSINKSNVKLIPLKKKGWGSGRGSMQQ